MPIDFDIQSSSTPAAASDDKQKTRPETGAGDQTGRQGVGFGVGRCGSLVLTHSPGSSDARIRLTFPVEPKSPESWLQQFVRYTSAPFLA